MTTSNSTRVNPRFIFKVLKRVMIKTSRDVEILTQEFYQKPLPLVGGGYSAPARRSSG
jgi:hypothetical protein